MGTLLQNSLKAVFDVLSGIAVAQAGDRLLHNLLLCIERHRGTIDWLLTVRSTGHVKGRTRRVLAWAIAEICWMDGVPAPAVTDAAVDFVKRRHSASEAAFVNGFCRSFCNDLRNGGLGGMLAGAPEYIRYDLPQELWKRWLSAYGKDKTVELAEVLWKPAQVILRLKSWPDALDCDFPGLVPVAPPEWAPWARLFTPDPSFPPDLDARMATGMFYIQDMATLLAPALMAPQDEQIADLCSAPGGKARLMAEMMRGKGRVHCSDVSEKKLPRLNANLADLPNVSVACLNAAEDPLPQQAYDGVLLDVPCSNTGVIRRKPDVRWSFSTSKLNELLLLQARILDNAAGSVKAGGRLVYSTCSIEREENELQVRAFLERHPEFSLKEQRVIFPSTEHDGAFAALLVKS